MNARIESIERLGGVGEMVCDSLERIEAVRVAFGSLLVTVRKWAATRSRSFRASCSIHHRSEHLRAKSGWRRRTWQDPAAILTTITHEGTIMAALTLRVQRGEATAIAMVGLYRLSGARQ
jgi:hypothetical protein